MIKPPTLFSPMGYHRAAKFLGIFLMLLGLFFYEGHGFLVPVGALLLVISGIIQDVQRNYVGLILLTKAMNCDVEKELDERITSIGTQVGDLQRQHNPIVSEIEELKAEVAELKRELAKTNTTLQPGYEP